MFRKFLSKFEKKPSVSEKKDLISHDDLITVKTISTFNPYGKPKISLSVNDDKRTEFFRQHDLVDLLIRQHKQNPLLEEGKYERYKREHKGELFITPDAVALLINRKIRQHKTSKNGLVYNSKNVFVIDNDLIKLSQLLENLQLKDKEDAKFIYVDQVHAIAIYVRNEDGQIKCFIFDSQSITCGSLTIAHDLNSSFTNPLVFISGANQQKDFYSCFTFATKALMYFCKHGAEIFPHIAKKETQKHVDCEDLHILNEIDLMPTLLKMSQEKFELSKETLDSIVSFKSKKTLREYLNENEVVIDEKSFNAAALKKRYKFFAEINDILNEFKTRPSASLPLPSQAFKIIQELATPPKHYHFVDTCIELIGYIENSPPEKKGQETSLLDEETRVLHKQLKQQLGTYESQCKEVLQDIDLESKHDFNKVNLLKKIIFLGLYVELKDASKAYDYADYYIQQFINYFKTSDSVLKHLKEQQITNSNQFVIKLQRLSLEIDQLSLERTVSTYP